MAKEEIAGDEGVLTQDGFKDTEYIGIPLLKTAASVIYSTYPAPEQLVKRSLQSLISAQETDNGRIHVGTFVTLSTCTGTAVRARELEARYHGLCENMEGAAVAQVAELDRIPWLEVRGISNIVEDRDLEKWDIPRAAGRRNRRSCTSWRTGRGERMRNAECGMRNERRERRSIARPCGAAS